MENNSTDKKTDISKQLIYRDVKFTKICFEFNTLQFDEDVAGTFNESFDVQINWILTATKKDLKGIIISCDFKLGSKSLDIKILVQTKMEFNKELTESDIFNNTSLQVLTATLFFPYLTEIVSCNTAKMGITPVVIGYDVLDKIIDKTNEQGGFVKPPIPPPSKQ